MHRTDGFRDFTSVELCGVLSLFSALSLPEPPPPPSNANVGLAYRTACEVEEEFTEYERSINIDSIAVQAAVRSDAASLMMMWYAAESPEECIEVKNAVTTHGIFIGEFVKGVLKTATISDELTKIAESAGNTQLMTQLGSVRKGLLKDVATNSSLYL
jgi:hypothetical protein